MYANNGFLSYQTFLYCNVCLSYCPGTVLFLDFSDCCLDQCSTHQVRSMLASRNVWNGADPRHELEHPNRVTQEFLV